MTLLTGASSGIGIDLARQLSESRRLILVGRNEERLARTRDLCARPEEHLTCRMDLADIPTMSSTLEQFVRDSGVAIEAFVHCAGVLKILPMRLVDQSAAIETMNVNFLSAVEIIRLLLKRQVNQNQLRNIVFISSTASEHGARGFNLYSASKGALDALMRSLAVELAPAVRVNSVLPGAVRTEMTEAMFADAALKERMQKDYPLGIGTGSDIADAVDFLLSERARWITGQQLTVDGGRTINITA